MLFRSTIINHSPVRDIYTETVNRESAYELLSVKAQKATPAQDASNLWGGIAAAAVGAAGSSMGRSLVNSAFSAATGTSAKPRRGGRQPASLAETVAKSALRTAGSQIGREVVRGLLGAMLKR
mgnify:CR=1 FL=1